MSKSERVRLDLRARAHALTYIVGIAAAPRICLGDRGNLLEKRREIALSLDPSRIADRGGQAAVTTLEGERSGALAHATTSQFQPTDASYSIGGRLRIAT